MATFAEIQDELNRVRDARKSVRAAFGKVLEDLLRELRAAWRCNSNEVFLAVPETRDKVLPDEAVQYITGEKWHATAGAWLIVDLVGLPMHVPMALTMRQHDVRIQISDEPEPVYWSQPMAPEAVAIAVNLVERAVRRRIADFAQAADF